MATRALVYTTGERNYFSAGRSIRSLRALGAESECIGPISTFRLRSLLNERGPVLFLKSGCWLVRPELFEWPASSATGRGLCAVGLAEPPPFMPPDSGASAM